MLKITIPGNPVAKGRPRLGRYTTYTPQKTKDYEKQIQVEFLNQKPPGFKKLEGALRMDIFAYMPIPKSTSKKQLKILQLEKIPHQKKPDFDNLGKIVSDALNDLAYKDDGQIADGRVRKIYSKNPRMEVFISEIAILQNW